MRLGAIGFTPANSNINARINADRFGVRKPAPPPDPAFVAKLQEYVDTLGRRVDYRAQLVRITQVEKLRAEVEKERAQLGTEEQTVMDRARATKDEGAYSSFRQRLREAEKRETLAKSHIKSAQTRMRAVEQDVASRLGLPRSPTQVMLFRAGLKPVGLTDEEKRAIAPAPLESLTPIPQKVPSGKTLDRILRRNGAG